MKKILVMLGFVAASVAANASYLYWQVADTEFNNKSINAVSIKGESTFEHIYYYDVNTGSKSEVYSENGMVAANPSATYVIDLGNNNYDSNYAFYIELYNYDASAQSFTNIGYTTETYDNLVTKGYVSNTLTTIPAAWTGDISGGGGGYNVPEPTSAMLLLIGLAGLALKRKQI